MISLACFSKCLKYSSAVDFQNKASHLLIEKQFKVKTQLGILLHLLVSN
jgi:hypothetical protein